MKKALVFVCAVMMSTSTFAAVKCAPDGRGGMCCWDTVRDGPFKPLAC